MRILFITDPLETFKTYKDSTYAMMTEAAARGTRVLATPLPAARALLGDLATWLPPDDPAPWAAHVAEIASSPRHALQPMVVPGWSGHFQTVSNAVISQASARN